MIEQLEKSVQAVKDASMMGKGPAAERVMGQLLAVVKDQDRRLQALEGGKDAAQNSTE